ncbi:MAG: MFS transporter [Acidimicrobiia bacterium]
MNSKGLLTGAFVLVWFAALTEGLSWALFLHFPGYLQDLGASEVQIGVVVGVASLTSIAARPWVGQASDTRGRRPLILLGNAINVLALFLYLTVSSIGPWLYVVRIIHGIGIGILFPVLFTYAADVVPEDRRTQGLALFGVSGLLPIALGGVIGDLVLGLWDFQALFMTALSFAIIALLLSLSLRETVKMGESSAVPRRGFFRALGDRRLLPLWFIIGVFALVLTSYFIFLKTFIGETGIGSVGLFFAVYAVTAILLRVSLGWLPDRVGPRRVLYPSFGALALGFLVLAGTGSALHIALAGMLSGIGHGFGFPILLTMVVDRATDAERGSAVALFTTEIDLGLLIGGPVLGAVIDVWGYSAMFAACAFVIVAAIPVFSMWDRAAIDRAVQEV